jgi:acid phosphatase
VRVFYVSNRDAGQIEATRDNLAKLGFPDAQTADTLYFQDPAKGWKDKSSRRAAVAKTHRVVLMVGDNLFDFVERDQPDLAARAAMVRDNGGWWGTRWFIVPNPMYGSWDDVLIAYDRKQSAAAKHERRVGALDRAQ